MNWLNPSLQVIMAEAGAAYTTKWFTLHIRWEIRTVIIIRFIRDSYAIGINGDQSLSFFVITKFRTVYSWPKPGFSVAPYNFIFRHYFILYGLVMAEARLFRFPLVWLLFMFLDLYW